VEGHKGLPQSLPPPRGAKYKYVVCINFTLDSNKCTNNIEESEVVILGLRKLRALEVRTCIVKTDSKIVVVQVEKDRTAWSQCFNI
jgi:ribonuclease HI